MTEVQRECLPTTAYAISTEATSLSTTPKALGDPLRLRMLSAIATDPRGESCVCDLAEQIADDLSELSRELVEQS